MTRYGSVILDVTKYGCDKDMRYEPFRPDVLKALRAEKKVTQKELSEASGLSLDTIKKLENGTNKPGLDTLSILGKYFNLFLYGEWDDAKKDESPSK